MRPVNIQKIKYADNLASKRRQRFKAKAVGLVALVIVAIAGIVYGLFYTPWLQASSTVIEGLTEQHQAEIKSLVEERLNRRKFGIPVGRSLLFTSTDSLKADLANQFSFLEKVSADKDYPHTLYISGVERQAEGIWCIVDKCKYFDHQGVAWGETMPSSGFLLLSVDDRRSILELSSFVIDMRFLKAIQAVVPVLSEQGVKIKKIIIPEGSFTEFNALVSEGYELRFSLDSNIPNQLEAYRIFRKEKLAKMGIQLQYIDLRFDDRIYFK